MGKIRTLLDLDDANEENEHSEPTSYPGQDEEQLQGRFSARLALIDAMDEERMQEEHRWELTKYTDSEIETEYKRRFMPF